MPTPTFILCGPPRCDACRNRLVVQWRYLPRHVWGRMATRNDLVARLGQEEGEEVGFFPLLRAATLWDATLGVKFVTYAHTCIWRWLWRYANDRYAEDVKLWQQDGDGSLAGRLPARAAAAEGPCDEVLLLRAALDGLPPREQEAVRLRLQGLTLERAGQEMGVSKERVRQLVARATGTLRAALVEGVRG